MLTGRGLCDELITRPEESYRLWCVVMCDLETSRMGAPYTYDISRLRVKEQEHLYKDFRRCKPFFVFHAVRVELQTSYFTIRKVTQKFFRVAASGGKSYS